MTADGNITLRAIDEASGENLKDLLTDKTVTKTYMVPDLSPEEAEELCRRLCAMSLSEERYVRGIYLGDTLIGIVNDTGTDGTEIELGWALSPAYHGKGYATEAVKQAISDMFALRFFKVTAGAFRENAASIRVMQKCGMTATDRTELIEYRGSTHECVYYEAERPRSK